MGKSVLAISNGEGFLLKKGKGGYSLLPPFDTDILLLGNCVDLYVPILGEVSLTGAFERLPLPFDVRYFKESEADSLSISPSERLLLRLCFVFKPLLFGKTRVHPLSPDDEKMYRGLIRSLRKKGMKKENVEAIKRLSRYECAYSRLEAAARLVSEKEDDKEAA